MKTDRTAAIKFSNILVGLAALLWRFMAVKTFHAKHYRTFMIKPDGENHDERVRSRIRAR